MSRIVTTPSFDKINYLLALESLLDFVALCVNGFVLKWRLTFGTIGHEHPHIPEERHIWLTNSYLNLSFISLCIDMFLPLFLFFVKLEKIKLFYIVLTYILIGGSIYIFVPLEEELKVDPNLLMRHNIIVYYVLISLITVLKVYWFLKVFKLT